MYAGGEMQVNFDVPEDVARVLASGQASLSRTALESLAAESYRSGLLSETQVMRLLGLPCRIAVHDWLRERQIPYRYTEADLSNDLADLAQLGLRQAR
jgi:predicted HTH domain antitoxin